MRQKVRGTLRRLSLARQYQLASLLILVLGLIGIGAWVGRQIEAGIIQGTGSTTALYVDSFVSPQLSDLAKGQPMSLESTRALSGLLRDTPLGKQIVAFKVWGRNGLVLYDSDWISIGNTFPVEPRLAQAWQGQTTSRVSNLVSVENVSERKLARRLLETYTPVREISSGRIIAVAEFYQTIDELSSDIATAQRWSWLVVTAAMLVIFLLLSGFVQRAGNTIKGQQTELTAQVDRLQELLAQNDELHERVRRSAAQTAALNERFLRRISAELHDGPAQEISLALLRIDPGGVEAGESDQTSAAVPLNGSTDSIRTALRHALEEIRAISAGLGLPELERIALPETVQRAVRAHERRTGTHVSVRQERVPDRAPLAVKITVYRLIQEALTNAYLHAGGAGQQVSVKSEGGELEVAVRDAGPGFDTAQLAGSDSHLGLLGMRERVQSLGGLFRVESGPGRGTRVVACLPLGAQEGPYDR